MKSYITMSADDTFAFGVALGENLRAGDTVLLYGGLGAGKSVLARGAAHALGVTEHMASPTFTIMQPYQGNGVNVYHFDLYRLSSADELFATGLYDNLGGDGVALVEWPQQAEVSPECRIEIDIEHRDGESERKIDVGVFGMNGRERDIIEALKRWEAV